jgi:two-component system, sensor histidine kinase and response regulator
LEKTELRLKPRILIIEDEGLLSQMYSEKLIEDGYDCLVAKTGHEGLEKARSSQPDLIVCDVIMQDLDGLSILKEIKADDKLKTVPFILLSNLDQDEYVRMAMEAGVSAYLIKVKTLPADIVSRIKELLKAQGKVPLVK